jgi:hypothetical protein
MCKQLSSYYLLNCSHLKAFFCALLQIFQILESGNCSPRYVTVHVSSIPNLDNQWISKQALVKETIGCCKKQSLSGLA